MYKDAVHHLGANKTPQFIVRIGKVLGPLTAPKAVHFSVQIHVSGSHTCCSDSKDVEIIVEELKKCYVFSETPSQIQNQHAGHKAVHWTHYHFDLLIHIPM